MLGAQGSTVLIPLSFLECSAIPARAISHILLITEAFTKEGNV